MSANTQKKQTASELPFEKELESMTTKSAKIRFLDSQGLTRSEIAKRLDIRYQHVRNVLITPVKKAQ